MLYVDWDVPSKRLSIGVLGAKGLVVQRRQVRQLDQLLRMVPTVLLTADSVGNWREQITFCTRLMEPRIAVKNRVRVSSERMDRDDWQRK